MWWKQCLVSLADALGQRKAPNGLAHSQLNTEHICMHAGKHTHWLCGYQHSWLLDTELFPATECLSINENRMDPPTPLFSQVTIAMEPWGGSLDLNSVGVEQTKAGKTQGARGGSRGNVCAGDFERLHVGLEGKKEKRVKVNYRERERKKHVFIWTETMTVSDSCGSVWV